MVTTKTWAKSSTELIMSLIVLFIERILIVLFFCETYQSQKFCFMLFVSSGEFGRKNRQKDH